MKKFRRIYVEITNVCNMNCSFCSELKRKKEFMSEESFRRVIAQIKPFTDYVYFHVKGEPLMHPLIGRFLDICAEENMTVNITTNGTLLGMKSDELIGKKALRQVNISLHSFEEGSSEDFDGYISEVTEFVKRAKENVFVVMRLWNLRVKESPRNILIMEKLGQAFGINESIAEMIGAAKKNKLSERSITLAENVYLSREQEFKWPDMEDDVLGCSGFCYGLRNMAAVLADGTVVPCCMDGNGQAPLGNIYEGDFEDIINSELCERIYNGFSQRQVVHPLCQRCTYRLRFNRKKKIYKVLD